MERIHQRKITRNREVRACTECRRRKLKCDRQLPCISCTKRDEATSCVYERNADGLANGHGRRSQAELRLEHLELLVQELSQSREDFRSPDKINLGADVLERSGDELPEDNLYNGATHWVAMLEDIEELRNVIGEPEEMDGAERDLDGDEGDSTSVLFGAKKPMSFQQVISQFLPPKHEADQLVAAYFRARAVAAPFIHTAQFRRQYLSFWQNPSTASPLWTSILFSILHVATKALSPNFGVSTGEN